VKWLSTATKCNWLGQEFSIQSHASPSNCCPGQWGNLFRPLPPDPPTPLAVLHFESLLINRFTVINGFYSPRLFFCTSTARLQCVLCLCVTWHPSPSDSFPLPPSPSYSRAAPVQTSFGCLKRFFRLPQLFRLYLVCRPTVTIFTQGEKRVKLKCSLVSIF